MAAVGKDTVYIDVDDEITSIIDKVSASSQKIVALVLPKRATVFQSIVNMRLLKRSAESSGKHVVLITTEAGLLPLAGTVGLYVAKNLQSKPAIPALPDETDNLSEDINDDVASDTAESQNANTDSFTDFDPKKNARRPIGELARGMADEESIELDDPEAETPAEESEAPVAEQSPKPKKNKKLKVPNFNKFRLILILSLLLLVGLGVFGFLAVKVLPKAHVTITTDTSTVNTQANLTLSTTQAALDTKNGVVPAKTQTVNKTQSQQVNTSGQKNNGKKATGTIVLSLADCSHDSVTIPAGTGVSSNGLTFITDESVTLSSIQIAGSCRNSDFPNISTGTTGITAIQAGKQYNIDATTFSVAGQSGVTAQSSDPTAGGTDDIVKIVSQSDIDNATGKIASANADTIKQQLADQLAGSGWLPIPSTFQAGKTATTTSAKVGDPAETVTVTQAITYTMLGVQRSDIRTLVTENVNKEIDPSKQQITNDGIDTAKFTVVSNADPNNVKVTMSVSSVAGPDIRQDAIKRSIVGKKAGEVKSTIKSIPGVTNVDVKYSPFWVTSIPSDLSKTTITLKKSS